MSRHSRRASKRTTAGRFFALCVMLTGSSAYAAEPWTLDDAVAHALSRPSLAATVDAAEAHAKAVGAAAAVWDNPEISWQREALLGDRAESEDVVAVSQAFDLSGARGLRAAAAQRRAEAAGLRGAATRQQLRGEATRRFYTVLTHQRRYEALVEWRARLQETAALVATREAGGDAAAWDRLRVERELVGAATDVALAEAAREQAWRELTALGEAEPAATAWPRVRGALAFAVAATAPAVSSPMVRALDAEARAARTDAQAAARGWVPELGVGLGWKTAGDGVGRRHGYVAEVALTLPLLDAGDADAERARAAAAGIDAEREALARRVAAKAIALAHRVRALVGAATAFEARAEALSAKLLVTVNAGYADGEIGILAVLDAHRGAADDRLRGLGLWDEARQAAASLAALTGSSE